MVAIFYLRSIVLAHRVWSLYFRNRVRLGVQAFKTAKDRTDFREYQIERYEDLLKEQKAMSKR
jgi:hypothetical protein